MHFPTYFIDQFFIQLQNGDTMFPLSVCLLIFKKIPMIITPRLTIEIGLKLTYLNNINFRFFDLNDDFIFVHLKCYNRPTFPRNYQIRRMMLQFQLERLHVFNLDN